MKQVLILVLGAALLASCSSTKITNSWRDPSVTVNEASISKVLVAALLKNETVRRQVEDQMASLLPGKAVQSYKVFGLKQLTEDDNVYERRLNTDGFDGIVMMRIASIDSTTRLVTGNYPMYYGSWRRYWAASWMGYYEPSYYTTDKTYNVEVTVYSLKQNKLIWTGTSTAVNPSGSSKPYENISKEVYKKMKEQQFLL